MIINSVKEADLEQLKAMTVHGADILKFKDKDNFDNSLLHIAIKANQKKAATFLLTHGIDINSKNRNGETALHLCCG